MLRSLAKSLSVRLLTLTVLWVGFMSGSIVYTMALNGSMEKNALLQNVAADMRARLYQSVAMVEKRFTRAEFEAQVASFEHKVNFLRTAELVEPVAGNNQRRYRRMVEEITDAWPSEVLPVIRLAREEGTTGHIPRIEAYAAQLYQLEDFVDGVRVEMRTLMRNLQIMLIVLALGSLFVIEWLLVRWVVRPTDSLARVLSEFAAGKLNARVNLSGSLEFQKIGLGFNHMAERLRDLLENLEKKVRDKTRTVEEKNTDLAQLYDMTSFLGRQSDVEDLCEGFVNKLMDNTRADAAAVFLLDPKTGLVQLASALGIPEALREELASAPQNATAVRRTLAERERPSIERSDVVGWPQSLRRLFEGKFESAKLFQIRNGDTAVGFFLLFYVDRVMIPEQKVLVYESFGSHLALAVSTRRLIERDRQYAIVQERNLMAQGLHDSIAQSLSFLNLQVQLLESGLESNDREFVNETLAQIKEGVQESYEDVRELLLNFRERVHQESFDEAVAMVLDRFKRQTRLEVELNNTSDAASVTDREKLQIIFILQEALANVRKHSEATQCRVSIWEDAAEGVFVCRVMDNGIGIDWKLLEQRRGRHVGMYIMNERAARIGGRVEFGVPPADVYATGTMVTLTVERSREVH